ncbi:MAG: SDR family oxidoreductase [Pseudomonadota bacterium]|nr:SDR family oxidoreductase [Pseudomonadota bacterium]
MNTPKVAIVTGSTSGIGKAIASELAQQGVSVMINSHKSVAEGQAFAATLPDADYCQANLANEDEVKHLVNATLERFGKIDIIVNNAAATSGRIPHDDLDASTDEIFQQLFQTNFMGTWYLCRAAMPYLQKSNDGCILNISSIAGLRATGSSIPYSISKAAVNHLTLLLANCVGPHVRVNAIAPGFILTPRTQEWPEARAYFHDNSSLQKVGQPGDIACLALGIINSQFITGQVITADGGFLLG